MDTQKGRNRALARSAGIAGTDEDPMIKTIDYVVERDDEDYELTITARVLPGVAARTYGPPEDCYPSEAGSVDILRIDLDGQPWEGTLTEDETDAIVESLSDDADEDADEFDEENAGFRFGGLED